MSSNYFNLTRAGVKNTMPGYKNEAYLAPVDWFDAVAEPTPGGTGAAKITVATDHEFKDTPAGLGFIKCYAQPRKNTLTGTAVGEPGGKYMTWDITVVFPGDSAELQVMIQALLNEDLVILIPDANCPSDIWQFGCDCSAANPETVSFDGGLVGAETTKAWTFVVKATCRYLYTGTILVYDPEAEEPGG